LRKAHPAWRIDWAVEPRWRPLLTSEPDNFQQDSVRSETRPIVDRIHLVPTKKWGRAPFRRETLAEIRALRADLRACEYDAVLDLQGSIRSAVVARLSGCRRVVGEAQPRETPAKWLFTERVETTGRHVIEQDIELAGALAGDLLTAAAPALPVDAEAEEWCNQLPALKDALWNNQPVVLLHPGGGWGAKRWPPDRYGALAEEFTRRGGVVLVNAGPGEENIAGDVLAAANGHALVVSCSLPQLIALSKRVWMVIGGDTGPLHLACALGKPVVGIYGPTDPGRNGPYGTGFRVLRNPESRQDHTRRAQPEAGLLTISPRDVMAAAAELMMEERQAKQKQADPPIEGLVWDARQS
jgi:heptosyltransferase I